MKNRIIALFLTIILIFSCTIITNAKSQQDFNKVTLSMYCNVSEKRSITGVYSENNFYVKVDENQNSINCDLFVGNMCNVHLRL